MTRHNSIINNLNGFCYALSDGNIKIQDIFSIQNAYNNLESIFYGAKATQNITIRESYNNEIKKLQDKYFVEFKEFHDNKQCFGYDLAKEVSNARDQIKIAHQNLTPLLGRYDIYVRNLNKYGNIHGPSKEYIDIKLQEDPELCAYKALITDGSDMSLNNNGFREIVTNWENHRNEETYPYPEQIIGSHNSFSDLPH